jgi:coenzyme F420-reducing hydrogenase gamma subunit
MQHIQKRDKKSLVITIDTLPDTHDHDNVRFFHEKVEVGFGYRGKTGHKTCIIRCPCCSLENYGPVVATGMCAWCGYNPNVV